MHVETITMPQHKAREAFEDYRASLKKRYSAEDEALMHGYKALAKGMKLLNLFDVLREAGTNHKHQPRLAVCRADAKRVFFRRHDGGPDWTFIMNERYCQVQHSRRYVRVPEETYPDMPPRRYEYGSDAVHAVVPMTPPHLRPKSKLSNFHVLWEPKWEPIPPKDPILLKRISGPLFAVLAQWDLTELERSVLAGRLV